MTPESDFTQPTAECPHPEHWSAFDDQAAEVEVIELVAALIRAMKPAYVVETGTHVGHMASAIGEALKANGFGLLDTCEVDADRVLQARDACQSLPVAVHQVSSLEFTSTAPIEFAWFDSLLELRAPEFLRFQPHMVKGAVVGFHDTGPQFGGVLRSAINDLTADGLIRPIALRTPRGVVLAQVL